MQQKKNIIGPTDLKQERSVGPNHKYKVDCTDKLVLGKKINKIIGPTDLKKIGPSDLIGDTR